MVLGLISVLCLVKPAAAYTHHRYPQHMQSPLPMYSWETGQTDLTPIALEPYQLPANSSNTQQADYLRRMDLEDGIQVKGTHWIQRCDVRSRDLFILDITQSLEGGFDSVNLYDKGILSWGIMQWAARSESLDNCLIFIKRRLLTTGQKRVWEKDFVANGIDVDSDGLIVYGKPMATAADRRVAFRGTMKVGGYDPNLAGRWATVFARAGRQPAVAELQVQYAASIVDAVLNKRLPGVPYHSPGRDGLTATDLAGNDPYTEALIFALWTNNPRNTEAYLDQAAFAARRVSISDDPALWAPGAFAQALLEACNQSRFGNWPERAGLIEAREQAVHTQPPTGLTPFEQTYQIVLAARKALRQQQTACRQKNEVTIAANANRGEVAAFFQPLPKASENSSAGAMPDPLSAALTGP
jgi:hypothetical protein